MGKSKEGRIPVVDTQEFSDLFPPLLAHMESSAASARGSDLSSAATAAAAATPVTVSTAASFVNSSAYAAEHTHISNTAVSTDVASSGPGLPLPSPTRASASFDLPAAVTAALSGRTILFCQKMEEIFSVKISVDAHGSPGMLATCDSKEQLDSFAAFFMTALTFQPTPARMLDAMSGFPDVPEPVKAAVEPLIDVPEVFDDIIGAERRVANHLEREYGVSIVVEEQQGRRMMAFRGDPEAVSFARVAIMSILDHDDMRKWRQYLAEQREKMVYVLVDMDEFLCPNLMERGADDAHMLKDANRFVNASNLVDVVSELRTVVMRTAVGSQRFEEHPVWSELQATGFSTTPLRSVRHADGRVFRDSAAMVLLSRVLSDFVLHASEIRTIILVSRSSQIEDGGGGSTKLDFTAYSQLIEMALQRFWQVELWSWRGEGVAPYDGFSQRFPDDGFSQRFPDHFIVRCVSGRAQGFHHMPFCRD